MVLVSCTEPPQARAPARGATVPPARQIGAAPVPVSARPAESLFAAGVAMEVIPLPAICDTAAPIFVDVLPSVTEARPGLLDSSGGTWTVGSFDDEEQGGWAWVTAAAGCRQLAGAVDTRVESPGWEVHFLVSQDGGRTFARTGTLKKPYYFAQVAGFTLDERGAGELVLALDDDYGAGVQPGVYRYETSDFGAVWSGPRIEPPTPQAPRAGGLRLETSVDLRSLEPRRRAESPP